MMKIKITCARCIYEAEDRKMKKSVPSFLTGIQRQKTKNKNNSLNRGMNQPAEGSRDIDEDATAESQTTGCSSPTDPDSSAPNVPGAGANSGPDTEATSALEPQPPLAPPDNSSSDIANQSSSQSRAIGSSADSSRAERPPDPTPGTSSPTTDSMDDNHGSGGIMLEPKWKQYSGYMVPFGLSSVLITLTVVWAFLSAQSKVTIFSNPQVSIVLLGFLSTMSALVVVQCVEDACNALRWYLAIRPSGVGIATFLSLSSATGYWGVLRLFFAKQGVGHRRWAVQR